MNMSNAEALKVLQSHAAPDALHTSIAVSRRELRTPGTRAVTLSNLESLATDSDPRSPDVIWMHGPAEAGKSAIMWTLATTLKERGLLLASFFFRSKNQRNTSRPFIPTLAAQAWDALPATQPHIAQAIRSNHDLFSRPAHRQSPIFLEKPLLTALTPAATPLTILVDGLDECIDKGSQIEIINAMVELASTIRARANRRIKIFIASRPEHEIKSRFDALASDPAISIVPLDTSDADVHLFYNEQFDQIRKQFRLPPSWPSKEEIKWLIAKTFGQSSFAGVATRFLRGGDPVRRLMIIREALQDDTLQPFEALDQLYATVFRQLPPELLTPAAFTFRCRLHPDWLTLYNPALEPLLQLPRGYIQNLRPYLSSLIDFDNELASHHPSLAGFLVDPSRFKKIGLQIDDRALSHFIQKCILKGFTRARNGYDHDDEKLYLRLIFHWRQHFLGNMMLHHPLPSAELTEALKMIDPPSLTAGCSAACLVFLQLLQEQFRYHRLYIGRPVLWYAICYTLPDRLGCYVPLIPLYFLLSVTFLCLILSVLAVLLFPLNFRIP